MPCPLNFYTECEPRFHRVDRADYQMKDLGAKGIPGIKSKSICVPLAIENEMVRNDDIDAAIIVAGKRRRQRHDYQVVVARDNAPVVAPSGRQQQQYESLALDHSESSNDTEEDVVDAIPCEQPCSVHDTAAKNSPMDKEEDDALERIAREYSGRGWVVVVALLLSCIMVAHSVALAATTSQNNNNNDDVAMVSPTRTVVAPYQGHCPAVVVAARSFDRMEHVNPALWQASLELEMVLLTNLIHAALLAAAAVLVARRGDAVWLYFLRHSCYFWTLLAALYALASMARLLESSYNGTTAATTTMNTLLQCAMQTLFAMCSGVLLVQYGNTCRKIRLYQQQKESLQCSTVMEKDTQRHGGAAAWARHVLWYGNYVIQVTALVYFVVTSISWWQSRQHDDDSSSSNNMHSECDENNQRWLHQVMTMPSDLSNGTESMMNRTWLSMGTMMPPNGTMATSLIYNDSSNSWMPFVMAYSEVAHTSFVLALVQLATTYPHSLSSVMACLLAVSWRLLIATASLLHILFWRSATGESSSLTATGWFGSTTRDVYSLLFTVTEVVTMIPIVAAAVWLLLLLRRPRPSCGDDDDDDGSTLNVQPNVQASRATTTECPESDSVHNVSSSLNHAELGAAVPEKDDLMIAAAADQLNQVATYRCVTVAQIAAARGSFSTRQVWGATLLSWGSLALLAEMTLESILLLSQTMVGSEATHDIYKWGMHACVMYSFCTAMSVETSTLYRLARWLLLAACPTGSAIAIWQLGSLWTTNSADESDVWALTFIVLLVVRALAGLLQTAGVVLLNDTEPVSSLPNEASPSSSTQSDVALSAAQKRSSNALLAVFLPSLVAYVVTTTLSGNCLAPMISPMLPPPVEMSMSSAALCDTPMTSMGHDMDLMLMQNMPGLGLFFHFGLVAILFAYQGIQKGVAAYKPSLALASLIIGHVGLLSMSSLLWDTVQTHGWTDLSTDDVVRRVALLTWSLSAGYLSHCLHRFLKMRLEPLV
jgi:hypothetical protein